MQIFQKCVENSGSPQCSDTFTGKYTKAVLIHVNNIIPDLQQEISLYKTQVENLYSEYNKF